MDIHGDYLVSCNFNQPQLRHNILRDVLAKELHENHVMVQTEVPIGGAISPADLALPTFDHRGPLAVDLVIHHPLALSENCSALLARSSLKKCGASQN